MTELKITEASDTPSFATLIENKSLIEGLQRNGITSPTPVQSTAIPAALSGKDLIVQAKTGSGKTLAFMLPILSRILSKPDESGTLALIISPTRELALQICSVIESVTDEIKPCCVIGGSSFNDQRADLREDSRIVVGTPGRILDLLQRRELILRKCRHFVLDEADEMLSMGFIEEVTTILSKLPSKRQGMFFSATLSERVKNLAQNFLVSPETINITTKEDRPPDIKHLVCRVASGVTTKAQTLCNLLESISPASAIVFCNTKSDTELVEVFMKRRGFNARRINSDLSQNQRNAILDGLRNGEIRYLIATDVAARGLDIDHLELVINYSIHEDAEIYVHRTGRTGRAGRSGTAISLVGPQDFSAFHSLKRNINVELQEMQAPTQDSTPVASEQSKQLV